LFSLYASFIDFFQCHQQQTNMDKTSKKTPEEKLHMGPL